MRKLKLTKLKITDDCPLIVSFNAKTTWKSNNANKQGKESYLCRDEDGIMFTTVSFVEIKPSDHRDKIIDLLHYFFEVCNPSLSPQHMWCTENCDYKSLLLDYTITNPALFESVYDEISKACPALIQLEKTEKLPLKTLVSIIEVGYPITWDVAYQENDI